MYHLTPLQKGEDIVEDLIYLLFSCSEIKIYVFATLAKATNASWQAPWIAHPDFPDAHRSLTADNTGSDICIEFALSQLQQCRDTHPKCRNMALNKKEVSEFLPTRLIDVGSTGAATVRLLETNSCATNIPYIALSHCWGNSQPLRLTRATAACLTAGIPLVVLPKTFQDAVHVVKKMQIRHLWIDSLCIVQDDPQDWQTEASRMHNVYSRAACCIAATAAKNSHSGLFFHRDPQGLLPVRVKTARACIWGKKTDKPLSTYSISCKVVLPDIAIDAAHLNHRAWVAQERYLSTGTIHFTQELLFWECYERITSEQDPTGGSISETSNLFEQFTVQTLKTRVCEYKSLQVNPSSDPTDLEQLDASSRIYREWCAFRTAYSGCALTKESDILVALNGVARDVAETTNDTLVAGLWRGRLVQDMAWRRSIEEGVREADTPSILSTWRAPTWSWASINRAVVGHQLWWEDDLSFTRDMAVVENISVDRKRSGELINASIALRCRLIPISPPNPDDWVWMPCGGTIVLDDCTIKNPRDLGHELSLVILRHCAYEEDGGVQGILLLPSRVKSGSYERVGYFELNDEFDNFDFKRRTLQNMLDEYHKAQETTIELV
ncbi:heterokaryon incompatibility protein-domain-containing protein [Alternaria rosae]|uniref:heterokaryon incompatibility protein-domain-containing protein n=1 Tax=Alternaria rosae TaxID=1187941 RepID=UPI001E8DA2D9|nr:heterokaryon incompatibility protein-domain-containing protein [Alternaria rosae]KAH6881401.1 heterokaryon incompatibility protein-domain-containing protein [Alternaria rosae]